MGECIFCEIVEDQAPARRLIEDERTLAFLDINPATTGHALVVPKAHADDLLDIPVEDLTAVTVTAQRLARASMTALEADGVNLLQATRAAAFQTVFHMHVHVIPRYAEDGIRLPWIPTPGDPERIDETADRLRAAL
jgi:histidine triad (HIT) family protein